MQGVQGVQAYLHTTSTYTCMMYNLPVDNAETCQRGASFCLGIPLAATSPPRLLILTHWTGTRHVHVSKSSFGSTHNSPSCSTQPHKLCPTLMLPSDWMLSLQRPQPSISRPTLIGQAILRSCLDWRDCRGGCRQDVLFPRFPSLVPPRFYSRINAPIPPPPSVNYLSSCQMCLPLQDESST